MSDKFDEYEQTSHWIKPVPSTFKVARQLGQNGHVMVIDVIFEYIVCEKMVDFALRFLPSTGTQTG